MLYSQVFGFSYSLLQTWHSKSEYLLSDILAFCEKNTCKFLKHVDVKTNPRQLGQKWNTTDIKGACIFLNLAASSMLSVNIHSNEILILFPQNPKLEVPELTALFKGKELGTQIRFLQSETWKNQYQSPSLESLEFFQVVLLQN